MIRMDSSWNIFKKILYLKINKKIMFKLFQKWKNNFKIINKLKTHRTLRLSSWRLKRMPMDSRPSTQSKIMMWSTLYSLVTFSWQAKMMAQKNKPVLNNSFKKILFKIIQMKIKKNSKIFRRLFKILLNQLKKIRMKLKIKRKRRRRRRIINQERRKNQQILL